MTDAEYAYAEGLERLRGLVDEFPPERAVAWGRMFSSTGVRASGSMFAFAGRDGGLIAKLPESRVGELVAGGEGSPVTMGKRTMREWVRLPIAAGEEAWRGVLEEAYAFVTVR